MGTALAGAPTLPDCMPCTHVCKWVLSPPTVHACRKALSHSTAPHASEQALSYTVQHPTSGPCRLSCGTESRKWFRLPAPPITGCRAVLYCSTLRGGACSRSWRRERLPQVPSCCCSWSNRGSSSQVGAQGPHINPSQATCSPQAARQHWCRKCGPVYILQIVFLLCQFSNCLGEQDAVCF